MLVIKDWDALDRPREKLIAKGIDTLSDAELLAIVIGSGTRGCSAVELARKILTDCDNDLNKLCQLTVRALQSGYKGIGEAKAISIKASLELARRKAMVTKIDKYQILSSHAAYKLMAPILADLPHEEFWVILLNRANKVIKTECISQGGITGTVTDIRLIMKQAIEVLSTGIILCHNHPSGNTRPSEQDVQITHRIRDAGQIFEIPVIDHLIVCDSGYYSFMDEGVLSKVV